MFSLPEFVQRAQRIATISSQTGKSYTEVANALAKEEQEQRARQQENDIQKLLAAMSTPNQPPFV